MGAVRGWLTALVVVTLLLTAAQVLVPEGTFRRLSGFIGGLILLVTLLRPLLGVDLARLDLGLEDYEAAIQERRSELEAAGKSQIGGLILLVTLLRPLLGVDLARLDLGLEDYEAAIQERRSELEAAGKSQLTGIIEDRTAAYISDKADLARLDLGLEDYEAAIQERRSELEAAGKSQLTGIIEDRTAAYISDKADTLGLAVTARITARPGADGVPVPWRAELTGPRSPELAACIDQDLGIPPERQVWNEVEN